MTEQLDKLRSSVGPLESEIIDAYASGSLSRRGFLVRGSVVGLSTAFMGAVIAACGDDKAATPETTAGGAATTAVCASLTMRQTRCDHGTVAVTTSSDASGPTIQVTYDLPFRPPVGLIPTPEVVHGSASTVQRTVPRRSRMSQRRRLASLPAERTAAPADAKRSATGTSRWPLNAHTHVPVGVSQRRTVPSIEPDANNRPSGFNSSA